jgi:hypothetical protein
MILKTAAVTAAVIISGCAVTVPVTAFSGEEAEVFTGTATTPGGGRGTLSLKGTRSGMLCYGAFAYTRMTGGAASKGVGDAECEDGRKVRFEFFSRSLDTGSGSGVDNRNMPFFFTYGMTEAETMDAFRKRFPASGPNPTPTDDSKDKQKLLGV